MTLERPDDASPVQQAGVMAIIDEFAAAARLEACQQTAIANARDSGAQPSVRRKWRVADTRPQGARNADAADLGAEKACPLR